MSLFTLGGTHFCHIHRPSPLTLLVMLFLSLNTVFYSLHPVPLTPAVPTCWNPGHPPLSYPMFIWSMRRKGKGGRGKFELVPNPHSQCLLFLPLPSPGSLRRPILLTIGVIHWELAECPSLLGWARKNLVHGDPFRTQKAFPGAAIV